jgi:hemoglobin-like flavoprotein
VDARDAVATARASYERCREAEGFFPAFYEEFFRADPDARKMFARTDFQRQHQLLRHAIGLLLLFPNQPDRDPNPLARVAERHSRRDLDIKPERYGPFVDSWIRTVAKFDPEFHPSVERAWREALAQGVAYMMASY